MQSNHHSSVKNKAQFGYLGFRNEKRKREEKKNPKKSVSKAVSKTTFLRNLKIRASFLCTSVKEANSQLANEPQNGGTIKGYFQNRFIVSKA